MSCRTVVAVVALAMMCLCPAPGLAQESQQEAEEELSRWGLPDVDRSAGNRVAFRLFIYYHFMPDATSTPFDPFLGCDADRGELCFDLGDWESTCVLYRCRTEKERTRFMEKLVELAREYPHSPEAMGHAIYAAVRIDRTSRVEGLLDECDPVDAWWCDLLRGYLLHETRRSEEAEGPLTRGLSNAPAEVRCELEDMGRLLPSSARDAYEAIPCEDRSDVHEYLWWLADPFWIEPGNDRWVEHVTRGFSVPFHEDRLHASRNTFWTHSSTHDEQRIKRGYRDSWAPRGGVRQDDPEDAGWTSLRGAWNHFVPDAVDLGGLTPDLAYRIEGDLHDEGYTRASGPTMAAPAQVARFLDADGLTVAVASDLGAVSFEAPPVLGAGDDEEARKQDARDEDARDEQSREEPRGARSSDTRPVRGDEAEIIAPGQAYFVTSEGPGHLAQVDPVPIRERVTFSVSVPNRPQVVGLEVFSPAVSARHRTASMPLAEDAPELSDLLLFRPYGPDLPETRLRAVALMLGTMEVQADELVGLYWEGYELPAEEPIEVAVSIAGVEVGLLGRIGGLIGLGADGTRATVNWTEPPRDEDDVRRAITLDLRGLDPGAQELRVELTLPDGTTLSRTLEFEVVGP